MTTAQQRALLRNMFDAAVAAVSPNRSLAEHLPEAPRGRTIVVGAGKGAAAMALSLEQNWRGPLEGMVVTRYDHGLPTTRIKVVEAAHPVPDAAGRAAALQILESVRGLTADDLVICLISGGGSALLAAPAPGLTLDDKRAVNRALLASGANITEMNTVRKHLSAIKGGRLAAACAPARVVTLAISDVPGDDPSVIGSGPTVADATTFADALAVLDKYGIDSPAPVIAHLRRGVAGEIEETPKPGDPRLARTEVRMIATAQDALRAAAQVATDAGYTPCVLGDAIEGEARDVALVLAGITRQVAFHSQPFAAPCVVISGGETTVTVRGKGRGGRNAEFMLALTLALEGVANVAAIAADTDGIDGSETNAGCVADAQTLARAAAAGLNAKRALADNDAFSFFEALGDLVVTGPTRTNVNDFRAILIAPR